MLCCVSYPFQIPLIYLQFILSLAILFYKPSPDNYLLRIKFFKANLITSVLGLLIVGMGLHNLYGYYLLRTGQKYVFANDIDNALIHYKRHIRFLIIMGLIYSIMAPHWLYEGDIEKVLKY